MEKYLITGGAGFIGSNIAKYLVDNGHAVRIIDNLITGRLENLDSIKNSIEFIQADIRDPIHLKTAMKDVDYVLHQAALPSVPRSIADPISTTEHNVNGTLNVLETAKIEKIKRVVMASSSSVYGFNPTIPKTEDLPAIPMSPYALSKLTGEHFCRLYYELYGLPTVALRYFNVFGPYQNPASQYAAVIPAFVTGIKNGKSPAIYSDGEQTRDFTFVENVILANLLACHSEKASGRVFNIGCGSQTSINSLYSTIKGLLNSEVEPHYLPERPGDVRHSSADISMAEKILDYSPKINLEEGLRRTIGYYMNQS